MNQENINNNASSDSDEISLKDVIIKTKQWYRFLLSKWITIFTIGIIGGVLGMGFSYFKKPIYTATTTFVLEEGNSGAAGALGNLGGLASMVGVDLGGGGGIFQGDNILELYKSRSMIQKALLTEVEYKDKKQLLIDRYIEFNKLKERWEDEKLPLSEIKFEAFKNSKMLDSANSSRLLDSILGTVVVDINKRYLLVAKPDKKLNIIKADVKCSDEFFSKAFNDQIVKNVNDFYVQTRTKKSLENVAILQQKTDSVRAVMNGSIYAAAVTLDATPNLNPTRQTLRAPIQRSQFNAETNKTILGELVKNLELSKISLRKETPLIQVIDQPVFPLDKQKFGYLKGLIIGGVLFSFLSVIWILLMKILRDIENDI